MILHMEFPLTLRATYVAGNTYGGLDGNSSAGGSDLFVVKYNSSGTKQWTEQLGTSSKEFVRGVATDSSGNVYVVGSTGWTRWELKRRWF